MKSFPYEDSRGHDHQENVPDPEDEVDLLIDDVDGQSAEAGHSGHLRSVAKERHVAANNCNRRQVTVPARYRLTSPIGNTRLRATVRSL